MKETFGKPDSKRAVGVALDAVDAFARIIAPDGSLKDSEAQECSRYVAALPRPSDDDFFIEPIEMMMFVADCLRAGLECLEKRKYEVRFRQYELPNYVSWLVLECPAATDKLGQFTVLYNLQRVRERCLSGHCGVKLMSKIFLHEMGHALLHEEAYIHASEKGMEGPTAEVPDSTITVPILTACPAQENEAYVFALTVWGQLVGGFAQIQTAGKQADAAWRYA